MTSLTSATAPALEYVLAQAAKHGAKGPPSPIEIPGTTRSDFAHWLREMQMDRGVEIGVKQADYSCELLEANPNLVLYSVDPWLVRDEYRDVRGGQQAFDEHEKIARERLSKYGKRSVIVKKKSWEAAQFFRWRELDFVYIDGHHNLLNVIGDIWHWTARVRPGGIIAGHDFTRFKHESNIHVCEAVITYARVYRIDPWFLLGRRHAPEGEPRERHRTWFWVRPETTIDDRSFRPLGVKNGD